MSFPNITDLHVRQSAWVTFLASRLIDLLPAVHAGGRILDWQAETGSVGHLDGRAEQPKWQQCRAQV